jgi:hypothetical protein
MSMRSEASESTLEAGQPQVRSRFAENIKSSDLWLLSAIGFSELQNCICIARLAVSNSPYICRGAFCQIDVRLAK